MKIDDYLEQHGMDLGQLARKAGLTKADISGAKTGSRRATGRVMTALFNATDGQITPRDLPQPSSKQKTTEDTTHAK